MAEEHGKPVAEAFVHTGLIGTSSVKEDTTTSMQSSIYFTAKLELSSTTTKDSNDFASMPFDPAPSSHTECFSSKAHWTELCSSDDEDECFAAKNFEVFRSLQKQYPNGFFIDPDKFTQGVHYELGEKIAEGGQGEIFEVRYLLPKHAHLNDLVVLKVFKGFKLQALQKQWPHGMLDKANAAVGPPNYKGLGCCLIVGGVMLKDGRFAFMMSRHWGDLRELIDIKMEHNGNQAPPFTDFGARCIMLQLALGMKGLHSDNIVHRDLKASNLLIGIGPGTYQDEFNPIRDEIFMPVIADFEGSVGVKGTTFWRAPEILLGVENGNFHPSVFTKQADVYSYAMTCCEILTGQIPFVDVLVTEKTYQKVYDAILKGRRPTLPKQLEPWIESLLSRCWHHDSSKRPSFVEIVEEFDKVVGRGFVTELMAMQCNKNNS